MSAKRLLHVLLCKSCGIPSWPGGGVSLLLVKMNPTVDRRRR